MSHAMRDALAAHLRDFPGAQAEDAVKFLHQSRMGPGHFVEKADALARLEEEWRDTPARADLPLSTSLGGGLCRLNLAACKAREISPAAIARLFAATAREAGKDRNALERDLALVEEFFPGEEAAALLADYRARGLPPVGHSAAFRRRYAPAYRVVFARYLSALTLFTAVEGALAVRPRTLMAVDGPCAAGKSTLAALLREVYGCPMVSMDHFFLPPERRSARRLGEPGGNVDYERFAEEVLHPLRRGEGFQYRPWDCRTGEFAPPVEVPAAPLTVVEGVYSLRPEFRDAYHLRVFLDAPWALRAARLRERNGEEGLRRFCREWIPLEDAYFSDCGVRDCCHLHLNGGGI